MNAVVQQVQPIDEAPESPVEVPHDPEGGAAAQMVDDGPPFFASETASAEPQPWFGEHIETDYVSGPPAAESPWRRVVGGFLIVLALSWTAAVAWSAGQAANSGALGLSDIVRWTAIASGPLALIGLGWLLFGRSARSETARFTRSVQAARTESEALQAVLIAIGRRLGENRAALAEETARLMHLGEEATGRLSAVTRDVDAGANAMARYAEALDRAAGSARSDIGALLADIPRAESQTRAMSELLRATGIDAQTQAGALEAQLGALSVRAREADEAVSGVAGRLTAHITQVESAAGTATERMEQATVSMSAGVDATLGRASDTMEAVRGGIEDQGRAMLAMIEQSSVAMDRAGVEAGEALSIRIAGIGSGIDGLVAQIAAQDAAAGTIVASIDRSLGDMEARLPDLSARGQAGMDALGGTIDVLTARIDAMMDTIAGSDARVGDLAARGSALQAVLATIATDLGETIRTGLADVEDRATRGRDAVVALGPDVAALEQAADAARMRLDEARGAAQTRLAEAEAMIGRQGQTLDALVVRQDAALGMLLGKLDGGVQTARAQMEALELVVGEADARAEKLARDTGPLLIEALLRVREAATQATERAREAIGTAIPDAAARLGDATGAAMQAAIAGQVTSQMVMIGETTAAVEARTAEAQEALREEGSEQFSRRVALLIESLNSTSIDVAKILSNEVTDSAWAQYLKGDRGVFTRRAVRLLDNGESREIVRHYEEEPEFREQVNRYIHDFEALLRRVLADRDGSPLGVTLLSSDMGKLYVALAQAIDRIKG